MAKLRKAPSLALPAAQNMPLYRTRPSAMAVFTTSTSASHGLTWIMLLGALNICSFRPAFRGITFRDRYADWFSTIMRPLPPKATFRWYSLTWRMNQTRSIRHFHNQQKNTSPDSARGGACHFRRAPMDSHRKFHFLREMKLCSIDVRFKLKLLIHTYRCTHALASSLLCQQYKLRSPSNSTHSTTRSQLTLSLCIPSAARRPGTISPLFTSTLLWNSLPSPIRSASSLHTFRQELQKYLGIPVIRPR